MRIKERKEGDIVFLQLAGRFDITSMDPVREWFETAIPAGHNNIVVNLSDVSFVDSAALAVLVQGMKRSREVNGDVRLCCLRQPVRMIFELTRLDKAFEILATEQDAFSSFEA